jgi:hypothetical protein
MEVDSALEKDIQKGQLKDAKIQEIKKKLRKKKLLDSVLMNKECYGTRNTYVFRK